MESRHIYRLFGIALCTVALAGIPLRAQAPTAAASSAATGSEFGIEIAPSTLGIEGLVAARLTKSLNVRAGVDLFGISHSFDDNGVTYTGHVDMRSAQATLDWYFWKSLHLSPGVLFYNGNQVTGSAQVPGGQSFTLNGVTFYSAAANPVNGSGTLTLGKAGPMLLLGVGNPVPRGAGHFSTVLDVGAAYVSAPNATLALSGSVCDASGANCAPVSSAPGFQSDLAAQQATWNSDIRRYRVYPILSLGFSFSFGHAH